MNSLLRILSAFLLVVVIALRLLGEETCGGGGGDGGVWILPRCSYLTSGSSYVVQPIGNARTSRQFPDISRGIKLEVGDEMLRPLASIADRNLGQVWMLPVTGDRVEIPANMLAAFVQGGVRRADILIVDQELRGYALALIFDPGVEGAVLYVF